MAGTDIDRRQVLTGGAVGAAGLLALAACSGSSAGAQDASSPPKTSATTGPPPGPSGATRPAGALVAVADVPVGGAVSAKAPDGSPLIVSRPRAGSVVAFSAICTHMGCTVAPAGSQLKCPCHGSVYEAATGKNVSGPAPRPLAKVPVKVVGGEVLPG
jgi:cytochrome b6-f complex iron-sulfur subunit